MTARTVFAVGDSVMQGAGPYLYATLPRRIPGIEVDAAPNRQMRHAAAIVDARLRRGPSLHALVVHLGTNGLFGDATFDALMDVATGIERVLLLTVQAPRAWVPDVNERIARGVARHRTSAELVDWCLIATKDATQLRADGFHLTRSGAEDYAAVIARAVDVDDTAIVP